MHEFSNKPLSASGLDKLYKMIDDTGVQTVLMVVLVCRSKLLNQKIGHQTTLT